MDPSPPSQTFPTRGYQQEMLDESLKRNIIIALDTGSGKTHIAVLRMKFECEREKKLSWFLAPTVALCEQQQDVISKDLPASVGLISGASHPDQWRDHSMWRTVIDTHRVIVSTPQPLLDALRHGYVDIGKDIDLIVFDEAHHAVRGHPYNEIMKEFYFQIPATNPNPERSRPMILGLTASPMFSGNVEQAFRTIETNLDCKIQTSHFHADELAACVHRPILRHSLYSQANWFEPPFSANLSALKAVIGTLKIEEDPYVQSLRRQLDQLAPGPERTRLDQKLSKTIAKRNTYTHSGLKDLSNAVAEICVDIGPWASDWYISKVLEHVKNRQDALHVFAPTLKQKERTYLLGILNQVKVTPISYDPQDVEIGLSDKVRALVESLVAAKMDAEANNESYSGLVFVTRRDSVLALAQVVSSHTRTANLFSVGYLLGSSECRYRQSFLDITRSMFGQKVEQTLADFRLGDKNLIISTSVAEEGIDIQSCCNVIRWDPPPNMVSWMQSRGRARRQRSTFTLLLSRESWVQEEIKKLEELERKMVEQYNKTERERQRFANDFYGPSDDDEDDDDLVLRVESTGALITPISAIPHLSHFCGVIPSRSNTVYSPIYGIDPPEFPEAWHSFPHQPFHQYEGPFGSTVTLPRCLDPSLRVFSTERVYKSKQSAHRHAAFKAYCALYEAGLLNDHLLPLTTLTETHLEEEVKALLKDVEKRSAMAGVSSQINPWDFPEDSDAWWPSELVIDGLPGLRMFTRSRPMPLARNEGPMLYPPNRDPVKVEWRAAETLPAARDVIERARIYTRELFWGSYRNRMKWDDLDFAYLFLPMDIEERPVWDERRAWLRESNARFGRVNAEPFVANAATFGNRFSFPTDLTLIRNGFSFGAGYRFHRWEFNAVSPEEEEEVQAKYSQFPDLEITYPLLVVYPFPRKQHLLLPTSPQPPVPPKERLLVPRLSTVALFSRTDVEYALLLPSIIRFLSMAMTIKSLRETLLSGTPLAAIPLDLLMTAITAPTSQESINYQRLETLGDTVLKFIVGLQLLADHPHWHEGYLSRKKDHSVSNARLAKEAISKELYRWILRDRFSPRKWMPAYFSPAALETVKSESENSDVGEADVPKASKKNQQLSTKVLADVVESLIGAAYLHGSFDLGIECAQLFGLGISWKMLPERVETILSRIEKFEQYPPQIGQVERMINYEFKRKALLIEALSHASREEDMRTVSYERMEFLGDSVLDMVVTEFLYHAPGKKYSPGHIHMRKIAVVNSHFLAFICLRCYLTIETAMPQSDERGRATLVPKTQQVYLWQCLFHSSHYILESQQYSFARLQKIKDEIENALEEGTIFPWAALTSLQAPKFFSDTIESVLGAVYLDSQGEFEAVRGVLRTLGILQVLERIVRDEVDVLHPVSRLSMWAARHDRQIRYVVEKEKGRVTCTLFVDDEEQARVEHENNSRASQEEVRFFAAERAIHFFKLRDDSSHSLKPKRKTKSAKKKKRKLNEVS